MTMESRELALYTINTGEIYRSQTSSIINALAKRVKKGNFDRTLAVVAFENVARVGAQRYAKEFSGPDFPWHQMFSVEDRKLAAEEMLEHYTEEILEKSKQ